MEKWGCEQRLPSLCLLLPACLPFAVELGEEALWREGFECKSLGIHLFSDISILHLSLVYGMFTHSLFHNLND